MAQRGVNEAKIGNIWGFAEARGGAGMRTAVRIGGGAAGTAAPTGPLQGPEQERKGER